MRRNVKKRTKPFNVEYFIFNILKNYYGKVSISPFRGIDGNINYYISVSIPLVKCMYKLQNDYEIDESIIEKVKQKLKDKDDRYIDSIIKELLQKYKEDIHNFKYKNLYILLFKYGNEKISKGVVNIYVDKENPLKVNMNIIQAIPVDNNSNNVYNAFKNIYRIFKEGYLENKTIVIEELTELLSSIYRSMADM